MILVRLQTGPRTQITLDNNFFITAHGLQMNESHENAQKLVKIEKGDKLPSAAICGSGPNNLI